MLPENYESSNFTDRCLFIESAGIRLREMAAAAQAGGNGPYALSLLSAGQRKILLPERLATVR
jgi:hypothetical protein